MKKSNIFWGLFAIVSAIFILVSKLCLLPDLNVFSLIITILLIAAFIKCLVHMEFFGIFFSAAFLGIIYDDYLKITELTPWTLLGVALLLSIGFTIIFGKTRLYKNRHDYCNRFNDNIAMDDKPISFGEGTRYINDDDFKSTSINCSFGSAKVYFENANIQNGTATVDISASFSGIELYIPKHWHVINNVTAAFGGVTEKNAPMLIPDSPVLTINGKISFGGISIVYI